MKLIPPDDYKEFEYRRLKAEREREYRRNEMFWRWGERVLFFGFLFFFVLLVMHTVSQY